MKLTEKRSEISQITGSHIWLTPINKIFKFPTRLGPFCQVSCVYELSSGYPKYPTQKWHIWASFQTSKKRFRKLQEAIWLTVINEIFKLPQRLGPFCQINYLFKLFSSYPSYLIQKWYTWASFQTSRKRFRKLQEVIWLTVINEIVKLPPLFGIFCQITYLFKLFLVTRVTQFESDTLGLVSSLLKKIS